LQQRITLGDTSYRQCRLAGAACRTFDSFKTPFLNEKGIEELTQGRRPGPGSENAHASITLMGVEMVLPDGGNESAIRRFGHWFAAFQR
jgi:hypothetical protein